MLFIILSELLIKRVVVMLAWLIFFQIVVLNSSNLMCLRSLLLVMSFIITAFYSPCSFVLIKLFKKSGAENWKIIKIKK